MPRTVDQEERAKEIELGRRIRQLRLERNMTQTDLARAVGWERHQYVERLENAKYKLKAHELLKVAEALDTDISGLLGGRPRRRLVPLFGDVGVGGEYYPHAGSGRWMEIKKLEAPLGDEGSTGCVQIVGNHLRDAGYCDGDVLFFRFKGDPLDEVLGKRAMVQLRDGGAFIGVLEKGGRQGRYLLKSLVADEPVREVNVEWAARIRWQQYAV